ncbi:uncharacterized protein LOC102453029 isoform X2 [Pelodiscus sinensis]|uniref:uncharacterized protein LOC102453029 isoform X2 n=1 Tax=Pelodiscus sinensis TaxID=13735 RepID=UPI003F6D324A
MRGALRVFLLLFHQPLLPGMLSPPQNVMLTSENFHTLLAWEPGASSGNGTRYEVESRQRSSDWTKVDPCWRDGPGAAPTCRLYFEDMHNMYWARVRATDGARVSDWAVSNELLPYRDTILGPPNLTLTLANENLTVNLSMPLTPYRRRNGTYKSVQKVLPNWMYRLSLSEEGVPINSVSLEPVGKITSHTFESLKASTSYCVTARVSREASKAAARCIETPDRPADSLWGLVMALATVLVLLLLSTAGLYILKLYTYPSISQMPFPKSLAIRCDELDGNLRTKAPAQDLEGALVTLSSVAGLAARGNSPVEQERLQSQLLSGGCQAGEEEGYCANGFGPGYCKGLASSSATGQLEFAGSGSSGALLASAGQMKDGDAEEGRYSAALAALLLAGSRVFPEPLSPVSAGLAREACPSDGGDQACSETGIPLHLLGYSRCSSPVSESRGLSPPPAGTRSSLGHLPKSRAWPAGWADVPLSSVRLQGSEERPEPLKVTASSSYEPRPGVLALSLRALALGGRQERQGAFACGGADSGFPCGVTLPRCARNQRARTLEPGPEQSSRPWTAAPRVGAQTWPGLAVGFGSGPVESSRGSWL